MTLETISIRIFGTPDYLSVLAILPPYDGSVRQFLKEADLIGQPVKLTTEH